MILLKTLLFVLLGYYALKLFVKWVVPSVLRYAVKKAQERFGSQFKDCQNVQSTFCEAGKTAIVKKPKRKPKPTKKVGEYIDFEEID